MMKISKKRKMRTIRNLLTSSLLLLLLAGCAIGGYQPVAGDYQVEDGFAILRSDSLWIAVRPQAYRGSYRDVSSNFFSMYVVVRNLSDNRLRLPEESFSIVAGGRQHDYVPLDFILGSYQQNLLLDQWQDPFNADPLLAETRDKNLDAYYELMASYFSFGELQAGASKDGYLFYNRATSRAEEIIFDALGHPVMFTKSKDK